MPGKRSGLTVVTGRPDRARRPSASSTKRLFPAPGSPLTPTTRAAERGSSPTAPRNCAMISSLPTKRTTKRLPAPVPTPPCPLTPRRRDERVLWGSVLVPGLTMLWQGWENRLPHRPLWVAPKGKSPDPPGGWPPRGAGTRDPRPVGLALRAGRELHPQRGGGFRSAAALIFMSRSGHENERIGVRRRSVLARDLRSESRASTLLPINGYASAQAAHRHLAQHLLLVVGTVEEPLEGGVEFLLVVDHPLERGHL